MAQKKEVYKAKVKQVGYWKYSDLYDLLFRWLKDHDYKINEKKYGEKLKPVGKEIEIKWEAEKKVTDYFKYQIKAEWLILGMNDAEVEVDGKKTKTNKGEVEIIFKANIIRDYEARWEDAPRWKFMRGLYEKYIIRETIKEYEDDLEDDVREIIDEMKAFLRLTNS